MDNTNELFSGSMDVVVTFRFEAWHRWPDAPEEFGYLANLHRHMFHVEAWESVGHADREVEIIDLKDRLRRWCVSKAESSLAESWSCEKWCMSILDRWPDLNFVRVLEDGENGAQCKRE